MLADYHVHCEFSDDSNTPMEQQIEAAIAAGLDEICLTDHVDYGIKNDWDDYGPIKMRESGLKLWNVNYMEYFGKLLRMRRLYEDQIAVKNGLEFGVQYHTIPQFEALYEKWKDQLDFILLSCHQVNDQEFWTQDFQRGHTQDEYNMRYYEEILKVITHYDHYSVLAHVDLLSRYDMAGVYPFDKIKDIVAEILKTAIDHGKGIEINTSSWHYKLDDTQPCQDILRLYKDLGGEIITIGSDAHVPRYVGDHFKDATAILKDIGFQYFCTYVKGVPNFQTL